MPVFASGINACGQIQEGGPYILCCPIPITCFQDISHVEVTFSHILWKTSLGWKWTGYQNHDVLDLKELDLLWKIFVSENRIVAINTSDSVVVWEKKGWRNLHFQKDHGKEEHEPCSSLRSELSIQDMSSALRTEEQDCSEKIGINECEREELDTMYESNKQKLEVEHFPKHQSEVCDAGLVQNEGHTHARGTSNLAICQVAVEDNALLALDKDGMLFSGCVPISLKPKITEVALGKEHNVALTADGVLLTWGDGMRGQLGIGELCHSEKPVVIENLQGIVISSVVCGGWHSVALSHTGDAYVWGWNESGQLGFPPNSQGNHSVIKSIEHKCLCFENLPVDGRRICKSIGSITVSDSHKSLHGSTDPHVESLSQYPGTVSNIDNEDDRSSKGKYDEVKRKKQTYRPSDIRINQEHSIDRINVQASPRLLDFWSENVNIVDVQCGDRHTLFQLDDGSVWSAGMNKYGQLGLGHTEAVEVPAEVFSKGITRIFAGGWNSVFFIL